jgi:hypothetical protein
MGDKLSCDVSAVHHFVREFQEKIEVLGLGPEQVYNADKCLFWRLLPTKTSVHQGEESAAGRKMSEDRIMVIPCSNASGTHKLEKLVIDKGGKAQNI